MKVFKFDIPEDGYRSLDGKEYWFSHFEVDHDNIPWGISPVTVKIYIDIDPHNTDKISVKVYSAEESEPICTYQIYNRRWSGFYSINPWNMNLFNTKDEAISHYNSEVNRYIDKTTSLLDRIESYLIKDKGHINLNPFDIVTYKPTNKEGIVKSTNDIGAFVLFGIQSTARLCKWEDLEI